MTARPDQKLRILNAAIRIVDRAGAGNLTISAVAAEAQLSKGGVLYHFPNKRTMLEGMLAKRLEDIQARTACHLQQLSGKNNASLMAWILAEQEQNDEERSMGLALLASAAEDPGLLEPARTYVEATFAEIRDAAPDGEFNLILLLATEGLRMLDTFRLLPLSEAERSALQSRLLKLAEQPP
jgi:AcrR family transcriptional regulator